MEKRRNPFFTGNAVKFKTGEFARLCRVNKKTLYDYDETGLLKPAVQDGNGYRYYTEEQIDQLSKIKVLQSVGLSLAEIKKQFHQEDVAESIRTLANQKNAITNKIHDLEQLAQTLGRKLAELERFQKMESLKVFIETCLEEYLIIREQSGPFVVNYMLEGYHAGVIISGMKQPASEKKTWKYRKTDDRKDANFLKKAGKFAGLYFLAEDQKINEATEKAYGLICKETETAGNEIYLEDVANDFLLFPDGKILFKISAMAK